MTPQLLQWLRDPVDGSTLRIEQPSYDARGRIVEGRLVSSAGRTYPIRGGVPRFVEADAPAESVKAFGDQWNALNFDEFRSNWVRDTVGNTFGSTSVFAGRLVVDAGAGSGAQSRWIHESGARHVVALELSHSVDDVMQRNLSELDNVDIVQASIDRPPFADRSIEGIVICHNVIQHTPSVEGTARALWRIVAPGGEFVFNCYPRNDQGIVRKARLALYFALRAIISRVPFGVRMAYAGVMSVLRFVPLLGWFLEKSGFMVRGDIAPGPNLARRRFRAGLTNTFDRFGAHTYQHLKTESEIRALVKELQPEESRVLNLESYFARPQPVGIALRLLK